LAARQAPRRRPAPGALDRLDRAHHRAALSLFFTVGHSTHPIEQFVALLERAGVRVVADVRKMPRSRTNPQFNGDLLATALARAGIDYEHMPALGGLRSRRRDVPREMNAFWENASFHNYADYAMSEDFQHGLQRLRTLGGRAPCALMCSEGLWWRCHRRIIADYLLAAGEEVRHIMPDGKIIEARMTPSAQPAGGALVYGEPAGRLP
jgi:uncharacterized protein (DUF488 family)